MQRRGRNIATPNLLCDGSSHDDTSLVIQSGYEREGCCMRGECSTAVLMAAAFAAPRRILEAARALTMRRQCTADRYDELRPLVEVRNPCV